MSQEGPDIALWRSRIARLRDPRIQAAVLVQCDLQWLRPEMTGFRNEIDDAVMSAQLRRPDLSIDRFVLHSLPMAANGDDTATAAAAARFTAAYEEWMYRMAAAIALLCPEGRGEPRVHRIIVQGDQSSVGIPDTVELCEGGTWSAPRADAALGLLAVHGVTTPLTRYDVDLDGPFGDADPSVYL